MIKKKKEEKKKIAKKEKEQNIKKNIRKITKRRRDWTPGRLGYTRGVRTASAGNTQFRIPAEAVRTPRVYPNLPGVQSRRRFVFPRKLVNIF